MRKYDSYKDSGIEWIGEIPNHWNTYKVKNLINKSLYYQVGDGDHGSIKPEMYQDSGIPYIRVQNLSWSGRLLLDNVVFISEDVQRNNLKSKLIPNDILIAKTGATVGKLGLITSEIAEANTTSSVGKLTVDTKRFDAKYILYSFQSDFFQKELWLKSIEKSAQPGFNIDDFVLFKVVAPEIKEQTAIANYLDQKTSEIDNLIAKKERLIQLLEEERTAIINQAVTKGLDPSVPMKDSGVEWLGEIPAHWERTKLKRLIDEIFLGLTGKVDYVENPEDGVAFIRAGNLSGGKVDLSDMKYISHRQHEMLTKFRQVQRGDVLVTKSGSIGVCAILDVDGEFSLYESVFAIRPNKELLLNEYLLLLLNSHFLKQQYTADMVGMGVHHLNMGDMKNTIIPIPAIEEQESILKFIKERINEIEMILIKFQEELLLLKEYKSALISEVVTGKVDVRNMI